MRHRKALLTRRTMSVMFVKVNRDDTKIYHAEQWLAIIPGGQS